MSVRIHEPPLGALKRAAAAFQSQPGVLSCVHHYDFPQWSEEGGMEGEQVHALLLVENLTPVGAASFEWVEQTNGYPVGWHLCFVWIADAFRRQGLLLKRWPHWVTQYGLFTIECPVSDSFQSFLRKVDYAGLEEELKVRLKEYIEKKADKLEYA